MTSILCVVMVDKTIGISMVIKTIGISMVIYDTQSFTSGGGICTRELEGSAEVTMATELRELERPPFMTLELPLDVFTLRSNTDYGQ